MSRGLDSNWDYLLPLAPVAIKVLFAVCVIFLYMYIVFLSWATNAIK